MKIILQLLTVVLLTTSSLHTDEADNIQTWFDFRTVYFFTSGFQYDGDYGYRTTISESFWNLVYVRPSVSYITKSNIRFRGGIGIFYNDFKELSNVLEVRPFVGIQLDWPATNKFSINHYVRLEGRLNYTLSENQQEVWPRLRYRIQMSTGMFNLFTKRDDTFFRTSLEIFSKANDQFAEIFANSFRAVIGLAWRFQPGWRFEINYIFQNSRSTAVENFKIISHIVRLRFRWQINEA